MDMWEKCIYIYISLSRCASLACCYTVDFLNTTRSEAAHFRFRTSGFSLTWFFALWEIIHLMFIEWVNRPLGGDHLRLSFALWLYLLITFLKCWCHDKALFPHEGPTVCAYKLNHTCHTWKTATARRLNPDNFTSMGRLRWWKILHGARKTLDGSTNSAVWTRVVFLSGACARLIYSFIIWGLHKSSVTVEEFTSGRRGCRMFTPRIDGPTGLCGLTTHRRHLILPPPSKIPD